MRPISPNTGADERVFAEEQAEYAPISYARYAGPNGSVGLLSRWRLSDAERARVVAGDDLYICLLTAGHPQPIIVQIGAEGWEVPATPTSGTEGAHDA
jgi:hypothetical protein